MAIDLIIQALQALTGASIVQDKVRRSELVIRLLKQVGLDPDHPPADYEGVYQYALVEYGAGKPRECLEIFRQPEVRSLFRRAFDQDDGVQWVQSGEAFLAGSPVGQAVRDLGLNPRQELLEFAVVFVAVAKRTRTPGDVLLGHRLDRVDRRLESVVGRLEQMAEQGALPGGGELLAIAPSSTCRAAALAEQIRAWFEILGYRFESYERWETDYFEWVMDIPVRRGRYDRVLVRGIAGEVGLRDVRSLSESVAAQKVDEGWLVTARRISQAARVELETEACERLAAYTLDELLDQDADFSGYLDWLGAEIAQRGIESRYVPLACTKEEVDPVTHQRLGMSRYGEADGWTEGYMDRWLDDPAKEHLSILGEFGTGKTWLTLHYAARALRAYQEAQSKGMARPRLPIVIPLRDYAKAVSVESLFSEFFFRKHEIPIPGYSAFEQLNRMGKLLLIFDGFDEMAARVDKQQMINNFWELAKVVVPGSKVILTCRTEHFPEAKEGRALLNAELQASTKSLTGETPQFEVLELEKFEDGQIRQVLSLSASEATVEQVMGNPQLLDLARRPVMTELILEALPDIEAGKPVDMSRVYLYAVRRKMERDIKADRTFTSMADKLYFLCELSWEMLSNDRMSLNYREFPERIRKLFGAAVQEEKDLDHWHYDMMGQTMLIRNADGDYTPAHRSLLEFFVAYKFAAELGALAPDFLELLQFQSHINTDVQPQVYTWSNYFQYQIEDASRRVLSISPLKKFVSEDFNILSSGIGSSPLTKAILDLMAPMLEFPLPGSNHPLISLIKQTSSKSEKQVSYVGGNVATLAIQISPTIFEYEEFRNTVIKGADFTNASLHRVNFAGAILTDSIFSETFGGVLSLAFSFDGKLLATGDSSAEIRLWETNGFKQVLLLKQSATWVRALAFSPDNLLLASGYGDGTIKIWSISDGRCLNILKGHTGRVRTVVFHPDGKSLISGSADSTLRAWDVLTGQCLKILEGHSSEVNSVKISSNEFNLISASSDQTLRIWNIINGQCTKVLLGHDDKIQSIDLSSDNKTIVSGSIDRTLKIWNTANYQCLMTLEGHTSGVNSVAISPNNQAIASSGVDKMVRVWDSRGRLTQILHGHKGSITAVAFNPTLPMLVSISDDQTLRVWNSNSGECLKVLQGYANWIWSIAISPNKQILASAGIDRKIRLWDIETGQQLKIIDAHISGIKSVAFSPDGKILASASYDETVKLWNVQSGDCLRILKEHTRQLRSVVFSPNGNLLATASDDETVKLWDVKTGECLSTLKGYRGWVSSLAFSPGGDLLAGGNRTTVKIWDLCNNQCIRTLRASASGILVAIAFSPDGATLAGALSDGVIETWNVYTGDNLKRYEGHTDAVESVFFSNDGLTLASGSDDYTVKLWKVSTGKCLKTFHGHTGWVWSVVFSGDDMCVLSGSQDGTIKIWDIETGRCIQTFQDILPYEGMNITGVKGLTPATIASLKALGAVDHSDPENPP